MGGGPGTCPDSRRLPRPPALTNEGETPSVSMSTTIKSIQDVMRKDVGVDGDAQRIGQLVWLLFLKIWDDRERELALLEDDFASPLVNVSWVESGEKRSAGDLRWERLGRRPRRRHRRQAARLRRPHPVPRAQGHGGRPPAGRKEPEGESRAGPPSPPPAREGRLRGRLPVHEVGHPAAAGRQQDPDRHRLQRRPPAGTCSETSTNKSSETFRGPETPGSTTRPGPSRSSRWT